jgi:DNA-binding GntR family transcriptional regulator
MDTAFKQVYHGIRKMIMNNELLPGEKVSQLKLSKRFSCSPTPLAEAMRRLESEGLLTKEGRKMARVRQLSNEDAEGLYLVREGLESIGARLCTRKISKENLGKLLALAEEFEIAVSQEDSETHKQLEVEIHQFIAKCSGCPLLEDELNRLLLIELTAAEDCYATQDMNKYMFSHRAIVNAIADGDEDSAEYLMKKHIQNGYIESRDSKLL